MEIHGSEERRSISLVWNSQPSDLISQRKEEGTGMGKKLALSGVDEANANFTGRIELLKV